MDCPDRKRRPRLECATRSCAVTLPNSFRSIRQDFFHPDIGIDLQAAASRFAADPTSPEIKAMCGWAEATIEQPQHAERLTSPAYKTRPKVLRLAPWQPAHGVTHILVAQVMLTAPESSWGDFWALEGSSPPTLK